MKLLSIQVFPIGQSGWYSENLEFGRAITQLYGPNGSGKTPVVQSIAYCLGYPSVFRNDIYDHCSHVILNISTPKGKLKIKRVYSREVDIEVVEPGGSKQRFYFEKDYSLYLLDWISLSVNNLVGTNNKITTAYLSTVLPIFYLDQDIGYNGYYQAPSTFIKDQFSEMMRMIFELPPKNSFDAKKYKINAKERLECLDRRVESHRREIENARSTSQNISKKHDELTIEIESLKSELNNLKESGISYGESIAIFDRLITSHKSSIRALNNELLEMTKRRSSVRQIVKEINTEINTLSLNEEAKRVFLSFDEICGSSNCQLFSSSSESYGKNLLYLKDQIKDLERNAELDNAKELRIKAGIEDLENIIKSTVDERNAALEHSEIAVLVDAISGIKNQIFELQSQKSELDKIDLMERKHIELLKERENAYEEDRALSFSQSSNPNIIKLRADLRGYFLAWLDKIHTSNIRRDITFRDDFTPVLGKETISQLKGSTRTRAVLAYHAAILELMCHHERLDFGFLILDTPKQHEIHNNDLDNYIKALKILCLEHNIQVIFSTTEYHYIGDHNDNEWNPLYLGVEQKMFLKSTNKQYS